MKRYVWDIESNHYDLKLLKVIHCIGIMDVDTQETWLYVDDLPNAAERLMEADELIGHNIIRFDLPAVKQFYPNFSWDGITIRDTVIMSRMSRPKWFSHSLKRWGETLRFKKGDYAEDFKELAGDTYEKGDEWQTYSQAMGDYCLQDLRVNRRVYLECSKAMPHMYTAEALELEQYTTELMEAQKKVGVGFDKDKATTLMLELQARRDVLATEISKSFKDFHKKGKEFTPKRDNKRLGYIKGSTVTKLVWTDFNPSSRDHIAYWLVKKYKWEPVDFTPGGKPKISETVLESLAERFPEAGPLAEHFMVSKRLSAISEGKGSWFNNLTPEGRIHGSVNAQGTVTYRGTHNGADASPRP